MSLGYKLPKTQSEEFFLFFEFISGCSFLGFIKLGQVSSVIIPLFLLQAFMSQLVSC